MGDEKSCPSEDKIKREESCQNFPEDSAAWESIFDLMSEDYNLSLQYRNKIVYFKTGRHCSRMRLEPEPGRTEQVDLRDGRHQFIIHKVRQTPVYHPQC